MEELHNDDVVDYNLLLPKTHKCETKELALDNVNDKNEVISVEEKKRRLDILFT